MSAVRPPRLATLFAGTLAIVLACGPGPALAAKGGSAAPLTVTPGTLAFTIPLEPAIITATVQYTGLITASSDGDCASVAPASVPATKPEGSSVYVATFTVTPLGAGPCTLTVTDKKGRQVQVPVEVQLEPSHMHFVAHQDDDVLFMNPDIQHAIAAGHHVTTVYLTAGSCIPDTAYYLTREAGVMAAYARMAGVGVANEWTLIDRPIREIRLAGQPKVALVFFRLSASASEAGNVCPDGDTNLRGLWSDGATSPPLTMTALDGANTYTREQLIAALADLIRRFHPVRIGTLDSSGLFGSGTDPSGIQIAYPDLGGRCYFYDHSDHFYSAVFTRAAREFFAKRHDFLRYRGYNQANELPNVAGEDLSLKQSVFEAYGEHDFFVPDDPPFGGLYEPWLERQYEVSTAPAPVQPVCP